MQKKNRNNVSTFMKKCFLSFISMMIVVTGFSMAATTAYADELGEIYTSVDALVEVEVVREFDDDILIIDLIANTRKNSNIMSMSHDDTFLENEENIYAFSTTEDGSYRFIVEYTSEDSLEVKLMIFTLDVNEFELKQYEEQEAIEPVTVEVGEDIDEPGEDVSVEESNEVQSSNDDKRTLDRIPSSDELDSLLKENEYVLIDNETGLITIETHTFETQARALKASNIVTTGRKVTEGTVRVEWKANRSYYWELWSGVSELFVDGEIAYCFEPAIMDSVATNGASGTSIDELSLVRVHPDGRLAFKLSSAQRLSLELIANYGDKYPGHQTDAYKWATKILIWESLGWEVTNRGSVSPQAEINEINRLISNHTDRPVWHNELRKAKMGEVITLTDSTLSTFKVNTNVTSGLTVISKTGNTITFRIDAKNATLGLTKIGGSAEGTSYIYSDGASQKAGVMRILDPMKSLIKYEALQGNLDVGKKDVNGTWVPNTVFEISKDESAILSTLTTGAQGTIRINDLDEGTYYVREKSVPGTLVLDTGWHSVTIISGETVSYTATNKFQHSDITINKVENDWDTTFSQNNGIALSGATIEIFAKNDIYEGTQLRYRLGELIGMEITNAAGQVTFHNLPIGEYYATEKVAPTGYVLFQGQWDISIKYDGANPTVEVTQTGKTVTNQVIYGKALLIKQDTNRELLEGAVFGVYTKDGLEIEQLTTGANGMITTRNLRYGDYYFQELVAPVGYWLDDTKIPFTISEHEKLIYITAPNKAIEAKILVHKIDSETLEPLEGVGFKFLDSNNDIISIKFQDGKNVVEKSEWITDADGEFLLEASLPFGTYSLIESITPEGYNPIEPLQFTIDENQSYINIEIIGTILDLGNIENTKIYGDMLIKKIDAKTGLPIAGVTFDIYNEKMELVDTVITDENGEATKPHIVYGQHHAIEVSVPEPYFINPDNAMQSFFVSEEGKVYELVFENDRAVGEIEITKRDAKTNTQISGVEYALYDITDILRTESDAVSYEALKALGADQAIVTDGKGQVVFKDLDISRQYAYIELSAPYGYVVSTEVQFISFEYVDQDTPVVYHEKTHLNERLKVIIHGEKRDIQTKKLIPTADFILELKDSQGNIIEPIMFNEGVFTWEVDALEIYTLSESKAPEGYLLSDEIIEISTFEAVDGNTYIIEYFNELMPVIMLPSTGIASTGLTLAFLLLVLGVLLLLINNAITESVLEIRKTNILIVNKEFRSSVNQEDTQKEVAFRLGHYHIKWRISFRNYHERPART